MFRPRWTLKSGTTRSIGIGWLGAAPLAVVTAMVSGAALLSRLDRTTHAIASAEELVVGAVMGGLLAMTMGAVIWIPGLVVSCVSFGTLLDARRKATGLTSQERADRRIAVLCIVVSGAAIALAAAVDPRKSYVLYELLCLADRQAPEARWGVGDSFTEIIGAVGLLVGGAAAVLTSVRMRRRADFIRTVERGGLPHLRIERREIIRRSTHYGVHAYRTAERAEVLWTLDDD